MHEAVKKMLRKYNCQSQQDYLNALKEIFQEIALLGLYRAKFFEKAAFYGGSALRILYGLDRFSEDLDFSLLKTSKDFSLTSYNTAIAKELQAFGLKASVESKVKTLETNIESAFIKADSKTQLIIIEAPKNIIQSTHHMQIIKIKMEVDTNPPGKFSTESQFLLQPIPFSVKSFCKPDLFAGKLHALLCRPWVTRVKGRDWYDFIWYVQQNIPVNLTHLKERLVQSKAWRANKKFSREDLLQLLKDKIENTDFDKAKEDIAIFIKDQQQLDIWSKEFFLSLTENLTMI
jgi:predicted nucleotidyltransferase component of viral defense system